MKQYKDYLAHIGEYGVVEQVNYPLITISGLDNVHLDELVISEDGERGFVFNITEDRIEVLLFSNQTIKVGTQFTRTNEYLSVPVGDSYFGSVITPLGELYLGDKLYTPSKERRYLHPPIIGIAQRRRITSPFVTGVSIVDLTVPLGRGQKELILGDRKAGKTSFVLNLVKKNAAEGMKVVYAVIGKNKHDIKKLYEFFVQEKISDKVVIVASSSDASPSLIYITPFSAMTIAEYLRDQGEDVLVVFDDLSTHAKFHREISLVAQHFPGRESYPGDIFYSHAKLLERSGNFAVGENKTASITCLPIVETVEGDLSGYIPTNIMGMTDGHIFFDSNLFYNGLRPAVNIALSVTRVGKQTQSHLQREVNRELTAFLNDFEKMKNYSHFGAELSSKVQKILQKGDLLYSFFQQSYTETVEPAIQLLSFGLIWSGVIVTHEQLEMFKKKIGSKYAEKNTKDMIDKIVNVDNMYDFLTNINVNKVQLLALADIKAAEKSPETTKPPVENTTIAPAK